MLSKSEYRSYFATMSIMLKMKYFLNKAHIDAAGFSRFMKSEQFDYMFSLERLQRLYDVIQEEVHRNV